MRSNFISKTALAISLTALSGCGAFGSKEDIKRTISFGNPASGCLNDLGPKMSQFKVGDVSASDWEGAFECTSAALSQFQKFVVGSIEDAYTEGDLENLVKNMLVTNRPISRKLISSLLKLKSSVVGGSEDRATRQEVERLKDILTVLKKETGKLIPLLRSRSRNPNATDLIRLGDAIEEVGAVLGAELGNTGRRAFTVEDAEVLLTELEAANLGTFPQEWIRAAFAGKHLLFGGGNQGIEGAMWPVMITVGAKISGLMIATESLKADGTDQLDFRSDVATRIRSILLDALGRHGGIIDYADIGALLDALPDSVLHYATMDKVGKTLSRKILKDTLPTLGKRFLETTSPQGLTSASIDLVFSLFSQWADGDKHLRRIFKSQKLKESGVNIREFVGAATLYQGGIPEKDRIVVNRLIDLIQDYPKPLFENGSSEIRFDSSEDHSLTNLTMLNTLQIASRSLLRAYGSVDNRTKATLEDLDTLVSELQAIGNDINFIDPLVPDQSRKRFTEANLFTNASDGNNTVDEREITNYLAILVSSRGLATRMKDAMEPFCKIQGSDALDWSYYDGDCFRRQYFQDYDIYWENLPALKMFYKYNPDQQKLIQDSIRVSSQKPDPQGNPESDDKVGNFVIQSYATIIQYVESMFMRFDGSVGGRLDQFLDTDEAMKAFPVFYQKFYERVAIKKPPLNLEKNRNFIKATFAWTVQHGREPTTTGEQIGLILWHIGGQKTWKVKASRANIYSIIPSLNKK